MDTYKSDIMISCRVFVIIVGLGQVRKFSAIPAVTGGFEKKEM